MFIRLSVSLSDSQSICLSVRLSAICSSVCLSVHLSASVRLTVCLFVCQSVSLYIHLSICLSFSVCNFANLFYVRLSVFLSVYKDASSSTKRMREKLISDVGPVSSNYSAIFNLKLADPFQLLSLLHFLKIHAGVTIDISLSCHRLYVHSIKLLSNERNKLWNSHSMNEQCKR